MSKLSYIGKIEAGKLILTAPIRKQMLADLGKYEGKRVEIIISKLPKRSIKQNAYYWGVVVSMVSERLRELGHDVDKEMTHAMLAEKFNGKDICNEDAEIIGRIGRSTTELNKVEFMDYLLAISIWAATYLGITIPEPNSQSRLEFGLPPITDDQAFNHEAA